jgi:competence protein ComEC
LIQQKVSPSWTFFFVCLSFLAGVGLGLLVPIPLLVSFSLSWVLFIIFVLTLYRFPLPAAIIAIVLAFTLGGFRARAGELLRAQNTLLPALHERHILEGAAVSPPKALRNAESFTVRVDQVDGADLPVSEEVNVVTDPSIQVHLGDRLQLNCQLSASTFGVSSGDPECAFPRVKVLSEATGTSLRALLLRLRLRLVAGVAASFSTDAGGLISGLLIGGSSALSAEWRDVLIATGTVHLVALSGFNISIIAGFLTLFLQTLSVPRRWHIAVIGAMLALFVLMVGAGASVVRAAIMGMLVVLARSLGRRASVGNALVFSAALMVAVEPRILFFDVGFQLSFLATVGIIYLYPVLERLTRTLPEFFKFKEALLMSIAAELSVFPVLLYQFGTFSLISPLINMIVVPFIPFIMLFGFFGLVTSLLFSPLGSWVGLPAELGARFVLGTIQLGGSFSWSSFTLTVPLGVVLMWYGVFFIWLTYRALDVRPATFFVYSRADRR